MDHRQGRDPAQPARRGNLRHDGIVAQPALSKAGRRPSGTEDVYKIYAESFQGPDHLARVQEEAQRVVSAALRGDS